MTSARSHHVFISYSQTDRHIAEAICHRLEADGIKCWIASRDITPGQEWGSAIIDGIDSCSVLVLVFSATANRSGQVLREVERAVNKGLVIVPFRIEDIPYSKSLEYFLSTPHWFDAFPPPIESHLDRLTTSVGAILRTAGTDSTDDFPIAVPPKLPTGAARRTKSTVGELALPTGYLFFRTERFEPPTIRTDKHSVVVGAGSAFNPDTTMLELAFQLQNVSDDVVSLIALRICSFPSLCVYEDDDSCFYGSRINAYAEITSQRSMLGSIDLLFSSEFSSQEFASSGSLLDATKVIQIPPRSIHSFLVKVAARSDDTILRIPELFSESDQHVTLADLDFRHPVVETVLPSFGCVADVLWPGEDRKQLYSDSIYTIEPLRGVVREQMSPVTIRRWFSEQPAAFVSRFIDAGIKVNRETIAYRLALEEQRPQQLDASNYEPPFVGELGPDRVSEFCFYRDSKSPLRQFAKTNFDKNERLQGDLEPSAHRRSNAVEILQMVQSAHPVLGAAFISELKRLATEAESAARTKATYVMDALQSPKNSTGSGAESN